MVEKLERKRIKSSEESHSYPIDSFYDRLRHVCEKDLSGFEGNRTSLAKEEALRSIIVARELGILKESELSWQEFETETKDFVHRGTEHIVEFSADSATVVKLTIPPKFGLIPGIHQRLKPNLRDPTNPKIMFTVEFQQATPLEYLDRWMCSNDVFDDNVSLASVVLWKDGNVSFVILQPHYDGEPATDREISKFFEDAGWVHLSKEKEHDLYFNYGFGVLAIDAISRNCYVFRECLQPFDVIVCHPSEELENYLEIYPS